MWRSACGWVGTGARVSMIRRTSRGVSGLPRRFGNRTRRPAPRTSVGARPAATPAAPTTAGSLSGHDPRLGALAHHRGPAPLQVEVVGAEAAQLPHPQAAAVEQLDARRGRARPGRRRGGSTAVAGPRRRPRPRAAPRGGAGPAPAAAGRRPPSRSARPTGRSRSGRCGRPAEVAPHRARLAGDAAPGVAPGGQRGEPAAQRQPLDPGRARRGRAARPSRRTPRGRTGRRRRWRARRR